MSQENENTQPNIAMQPSVPKQRKLKASIAMTTYNGAKHLRMQIESILNQNYEDIELVISDDHSSDETSNIIAEYTARDQRILYIRPEKNLGFKANFGFAVTHCTGDIVFLSDQDDRWYPEKVKSHMEIYMKNPSIAWVYNFVALTDEQMNPLGSLTDANQSYYKKVGFKNLLSGRCILGCATSYRREYISSIWPIPASAPAHDTWIQIHMFPYKHYYIDIPLQDYRQHTNTVTHALMSAPQNIKNEILKSISYAVVLFKDSNLPWHLRLYAGAIAVLKMIKYYGYKKYRLG